MFRIPHTPYIVKDNVPDMAGLKTRAKKSGKK